MATVVINNPAELQQLYTQLGKQFSSLNYRRYLLAELKELETQHAAYFASASGPDGAAWPPLAPSTVAAKGHGKILIDTNALRDSLTNSGSGAAIREAIDEGQSKGLSFGTDVRNEQGQNYSVFHDRPYKNRPARRHVGTNDDHLTKMTNRAADYTLAALKKG